MLLCNPCLGHGVTHVLAICVTYVLAPHQSGSPPGLGLKKEKSISYLARSLRYFAGLMPAAILKYLVKEL